MRTYGDSPLRWEAGFIEDTFENGPTEIPFSGVEENPNKIFSEEFFLPGWSEGRSRRRPLLNPY